jgi:hypothetical protein
MTYFSEKENKLEEILEKRKETERYLTDSSESVK